MISFRKDWNKFIFGDTTFAHGANKSLTWLLKPLVDTFPAVKVTTLGDNWFDGGIQTNVTFKHTARGGRTTTGRFLFGRRCLL
jgi:hypothetical protein